MVELRDPNAATAALFGENAFEKIEQLLADRKPIYVRNNTTKPQYMLDMPYPSREGQKKFAIPRTGLPFNLAGLISHENLRECSAFRNLVSKGALLIVDEKEALAELNSDPYNRTMLQNALDEANNTAVARQEEAAKEANARADGAPESSAEMQAQATLAVLDPKMAARVAQVRGTVSNTPKFQGGHDPKFKSIEARCAAGSLSTKGVINELAGMLSELDDSTLKGIQISAVWPVQVQEWAADRLLSRQQRVIAKDNAEAETAAAAKASARSSSASTMGTGQQGSRNNPPKE